MVRPPRLSLPVEVLELEGERGREVERDSRVVLAVEWRESMMRTRLRGDGNQV